MKPKSIKTAAGNKGIADSVYKIFIEEEWNRFQESGRFSGSAGLPEPSILRIYL